MKFDVRFGLAIIAAFASIVFEPRTAHGSREFVPEPNKKEAADLSCLNKTLHDGTPEQLKQLYQDYANQMAFYLHDLPSYKNIWLNVNSLPHSTEPLPGVFPRTLIIVPADIATNADKNIWKQVTQARTTRQKLVRITTPEAMDRIDQNHEWALPSELRQIKPPRWAKKASDLNEYTDQDTGK